jgi:hypothetical protein
MKPEIKAAWIAALRSGKYQQTTGRLRDSNGFCCLGVLCDLAANTGVVGWGSDTLGNAAIDNEAHLLPISVMSWAGLIDRHPGRLADYNDGIDPANRSYSFIEIADLIERHL